MTVIGETVANVEGLQLVSLSTWGSEDELGRRTDQLSSFLPRVSDSFYGQLGVRRIPGRGLSRTILAEQLALGAPYQVTRSEWFGAIDTAVPDPYSPEALRAVLNISKPLGLCTGDRHSPNRIEDIWVDDPVLRRRGVGRALMRFGLAGRDLGDGRVWDGCHPQDKLRLCVAEKNLDARRVYEEHWKFSPVGEPHDLGIYTGTEHTEMEADAGALLNHLGLVNGSAVRSPALALGVTIGSVPQT
jgi:hypothetical protein